MSEAVSLNEKTPQLEAPNDGGASLSDASEKLTQSHNNSSGDDESVAAVSEHSSSRPLTIRSATPSIQGEESEQSAAVKGKQPDDTIETLVSLFRDFLEAAPNPVTSYHADRNKVGHKRLFGLAKGLPLEASSNNRFDYEQKYPRDRHGEELADNARVWLTYLDEAEVYDREKVEGWKETVDVLLVFAGLFSGVITTFVSQASQSLQKDNTEVSASLLFEIAQILRAQTSGTPINTIPISTLTPTSSFRPSTNAFLINGLWFTSLAIALSTALFAVLTKQWLYYYLSSISGTAHENVRARQLRFKGFELWKVGAIVDLLPILLHLAVGLFLTGIIILLFPLDVRTAWAIVVITGTTYLLYFTSVILPIRYPGCPYTTSLTIYLGVLVFLVREVLHPIMYSGDDLRLFWRIIRSLYNLLLHAFVYVLVNPIRRSLRALGCLRISIKDFPKFTNWREENIRNAIKNATSFDYEALDWLYKTTSNTSVHRIVARCVSVHPILTQKFESVLDNLLETLRVNRTDVADLRYGLRLDLQRDYYPQFWPVLLSIPDVESSQLDKVEYQSYSRIAENVIHGNYDQILKDALSDNLEYPLVMWRSFLGKASGDPKVAGYILTSLLRDPFGSTFYWTTDPRREYTYTAAVSFKTVLRDTGEPTKWMFDYLFRYFGNGPRADYSSVDKSLESHCLLVVSIYSNLTSDEKSLISGKRQRQWSLDNLFNNFQTWLMLSKLQRVSPELYFTFFTDICSVDAFWGESMTDKAREGATHCLFWIRHWIGTDKVNRFRFVECDDLSPIYQWCSRDLSKRLLPHTTFIFTLLFMPQNRAGLCTILSDDPDAVSNFSKCLSNALKSYIETKYVRQSLIDLFKSVDRNVPLFKVLYNPSVLVQVWRLLVPSDKKFLLIVESRLDSERLSDLHGIMNEEVQSEEGTYFRRALDVSARRFGRRISVSQSKLKSTTDNQPPEGGGERDHDSEERAQELDDERSCSLVHRTKKLFKFVWPKASVKEINNLELSDIQSR